MTCYLQRKTRNSASNVFAIDIGIVLLFVIPPSGPKYAWVRVHSKSILYDTAKYRMATLKKVLEFASMRDMVRLVLEADEVNFLWNT